MSTDTAIALTTRDALVVRPDFRIGLPLNIALFTMGSFWLLIGAISAFNAHLPWAVICILIAFSFYASVLLYYRNASLWADEHWIGKTDLAGRRVACARSEIGSVEEVTWITKRFRFVRKDGRLAFEIFSYGWIPDEIRAFRDQLAL